MTTTDIVAPAEQEGTKAVVKSWLKKIGDAVRIDDPIVELETDKVAVEIAATTNGVLSEILLETDAEVEPGAILGRIADRAGAPTEKNTPSRPAAAAKTPAPTTDATMPPPGIRRLLADHNLEARDVPSMSGRLTREDILA